MGHCRTCRFWEGEPGPHGGYVYRCHRYPPVRVSGGAVPEFPCVAPTDWCGEYADPGTTPWLTMPLPSPESVTIKPEED